MIPKLAVYAVYAAMMFLSCHSANGPSKSLKMKNMEKEQQYLAPCQACKTLVKSFAKGLEKTARGKFEGGDSVWEETKMNSYSSSIVRLIEIQEKLCNEVSVGQSQCHLLAEENEDIIESWWKESANKNSASLHSFLCIENLKRCCPENHYGPQCKPCPGNITSPCSGHGRCKGAGTRKGSGECACHEGYASKLCTDCRVGYYKDKDEPVSCVKCDPSCKGHCRGPGPKACEVCQDGYRMTEQFGCGDIDECIESNPCDNDEFCANTYGSYMCTKCHDSCDGCSGDGPDFCNKCASDYVLKDDICINKTIAEEEEEEEEQEKKIEENEKVEL